MEKGIIERLFRKGTLLWMLSGAILIFYSSRLADKIIHEPWWLILAVLLFSSGVGFILTGQFFNKDSDGNDSAQHRSYKIIFWIFWLTVSAALTIIVLTPFRFAIVQASNKQPSEAVACEIKSYYKKRNRQKIFVRYEFEGQPKKKKITYKEYQRLVQAPKGTTYQLVLNVRKSLLDTYVIRDYVISEK
jgi:hypothetical protein